VRIVIAKKTLSTVGGSEILARALGRELRALGHDVTLVGMRPAWARPGIAEDRDSTFLPVRGGRLGAAIDGLFPTSLVAERELRRVILGADVVHSIAREWVGSLERVARRAGAAFVESPLVHPGQPFSGSSRSDVARYRRDDAVVALTEWEASWYRARGATNVHVSGIGPNLIELPRLERDRATVLFVGRKERYKGYHALREAARIVWRERPDARFIAIGQPAWNARFSPPPNDPRWEELGIVSESAKAAAYARSTIFAMPSEHETFGQTYLEAWMAGLPVIAGDIPPLREVVREGIDGLHARNEPAAIAAAILALLRDPERARRMADSGRERVRNDFTWPVVARKTEAAYLAALDAAKAAPRASSARARR
jgi:glycosyltransferase involved in cell wall biosynthesis